MQLADSRAPRALRRDGGGSPPNKMSFCCQDEDSSTPDETGPEEADLAAAAARAKVAYFDPDAALRVLAGAPPADDDERRLRVLLEARGVQPRAAEAHVSANAVAYSWREADALHISIRGTDVAAWCDVRDDLDVRLAYVPWSPGAAVHHGFLRHYQLLQTPLLSRILAEAAAGARRVCVVGHSLGGAVALLATHQLETLRLGGGLPQLAVAVVTLGAPRVGNAAFVSSCAATFGSVLNTAVVRVENAEDPVPRVPPYLPPSWCVEFRRLRGGGAVVSPLESHSVDVYIARTAARGAAPAAASS